jgi:two-component system response regulator YesN
MKAVTYIKEHYSDEGMSLRAAAREAGFSPNHFSALFSRQMGLTFIEYLIRHRIEQSKLLLENADMKLEDVSFEIGYSEPRYFSAVFKKYTGMTPRAYRKLHGLLCKRV